MSYGRIHHTKIFVPDMDRSFHFYRDFLRFELVYQEWLSENVEQNSVTQGSTKDEYDISRDRRSFVNYSQAGTDGEEARLF